MNPWKLFVAAVSALALAACQSNGVDIVHGDLSQGNKATIITKTVCGGGTHVAVVSYDKRGNIKGQTQSAGPDGCTTGANVVGNIAGAAIGGAITASAGGATATGGVAIANAVAVSSSQ